MEFNWNSVQQAMKTKYTQFSTTLNENAAECYQNRSFDFETWNQITKEGIWKIPVPEEYGGLGMSWWEFSAALEGLASRSTDLGFLLSIIAHIGCLRVLLLHGTEEQKHYYLNELMNGKIGATAITESTGGSDVARIRTAGEYDANQIILNGKKSHITNAPIADIVVLVGRIPELGKQDITLFILEKDLEGLSFGEKEDMFGNRTSPTGDIYLNNVSITNKSILGHPGDGLQTLYNMISLDRLLYGLVAAAFMEGLMFKSLEYSNDRVAFKTPIANHQYIQQKLTDIKMNIETTKLITYSALEKLIKDDDEASLMCSMAKYIGTESLFQTAQHVMQIHGHSGYMVGQISKLFQDSAGTRIAGGTSDIQRVNMFNQMQKIYQNREAVVWN